MSRTTEDRVRDALGAYADRVQGAPGALERTQAAWRRRERRRRLMVVAAAIVVVAIADAIGLWALNRSSSGSPVIFDAPAPARIEPAAPSPAPAPPAAR